MPNALANSEPLPFEYKQVTTIEFSAEKLVAIALDTLLENKSNLEFDPTTVKSTLSKTGLTLVIEVTEGAEEVKPKKRKPRGPNKPKTEPVETEAPEPEAKAEPEPKADDKGDTPFKPTTDVSNEAVVAAVKSEAGIAEGVFSTETTDVAASDSGEAPAMDAFIFAEVGKE